jgi:hypothetical protein
MSNATTPEDKDEDASVSAAVKLSRLALIEAAREAQELGDECDED